MSCQPERRVAIRSGRSHRSATESCSRWLASRSRTAVSCGEIERLVSSVRARSPSVRVSVDRSARGYATHENPDNIAYLQSRTRVRLKSRVPQLEFSLAILDAALSICADGHSGNTQLPHLPPVLQCTRNAGVPERLLQDCMRLTRASISSYSSAEAYLASQVPGYVIRPRLRGCPWNTSIPYGIAEMLMSSARTAKLSIEHLHRRPISSLQVAAFVPHPVPRRTRPHRPDSCPSR